MKRLTLAQTLTALAEGATPYQPGMTVEAVEIDLPLIVALRHAPDGPVFVAHPPWSAFTAGINPVAHRARLTVIHEPAPPGPEQQPEPPD